MQYELPPERIAQVPCEPRDAARLLVLNRKTGAMSHRVFRELPELLRPNDCLVVNTTRVVPARFELRRSTGGRLGALFVREIEVGRWEVLIAGAGRVRDGEVLTFAVANERAVSPSDAPNETLADKPPVAPGARYEAALLRRLDRGLCEISVTPATPAAEVLAGVGKMPLPPYIRRERADTRDVDDYRDYQTVFAASPGAVAAPTAGLHFTNDLMDVIRAMHVGVAEVILHVGLGTFQPVEVDDLDDHPMHSEQYELSAETCAAITAARAEGSRVIAVGTTSVRVLESCARGGELTPGSGWTDLLIQPPYEFRAVDALITNFHLPGTTLLALVAAFAGLARMRTAYDTAIREGYRFFSYGDAMLIE